MSTRILEQALKYVNNGISVFAVPKPGNGFTGKKPIIHWKDYQNKFASLEQINEWFYTSTTNTTANTTNENENENCKNNIALVTGSISRLLVIDIDGDQSKKIFQDKLMSGLSSSGLVSKIENTAHVKTGGGNAQILIRYKTEDFPEGIESKKYVYFGDCHRIKRSNYIQ